ncbi:phosphatase PAP2 family protein [Pokkaliibacter sp. CJK22405]|uniref:phosphatase PAP2 family protein n=1 Tax=Pokkaliibacter sp. CJK22405 TaxID=3384615 RepID=UPI003984AAC0
MAETRVMTRRELFAIAGLGSFFIGWTVLVVTGVLSPVQDLVESSMLIWQWPALRILFTTITTIGEPGVIGTGVVLITLWLLYKRAWRPALTVLVTGLLTMLATDGIKHWLAIARPDVSWAPSSYSYPSGHTTGATLLALVTGRTLMAGQGLRRQQWVIAGVAAYAALVASSRIYLGVHWIADIVGGLMLASLVWMVTLHLIVRPERDQWPKIANPRLLWLPVIALVIYLIVALPKELKHYLFVG